MRWQVWASTPVLMRQKLRCEPARKGAVNIGRWPAVTRLCCAVFDQPLRLGAAFVRRVQHDQARHARRMINGKTPVDHAAQRKADDGGAGDLQIVQQGGQLIRQQGQTGRILRQRTVAVAGQIIA